MEGKARGACGVVVLYEGPAPREHALGFCNNLAGRHRDEIDLEVHWWSFTLLANSALARDAMSKAANADMVVFAMNYDQDLPREIKLWVEGWLEKRGQLEGALVGLVDRRHDPAEIACLKEVYLRQVAHRAGMDYLSESPPTEARAIPNSLESYNQRAGEVTSVLDQILRTPAAPPPQPL